jgi:hypothetical protein
VDVERLLGFRRGHQFKRLALKDADRLGVAVGLGLAGLLEAIDFGEQAFAVFESRCVERDRRHKIGHGEVGGVRVGVDHEWGRRGAEIRRSGARVHLRQADEGRHGALGAELAGDDGTVRRPLVVRLQVGIEAGLREVAGEDVVVGGAVVGVMVAEGTDERELVHLLGDARQVLANLDAAYIGVDRLELAAELGGRVGLEVPGVHRAETAMEENEDERNVRWPLALLGGAGLPLEQLRQREAETEQAGGSQSQEVAAGEAVTIQVFAIHICPPTWVQHQCRRLLNEQAAIGPPGLISQVNQCETKIFVVDVLTTKRFLVEYLLHLIKLLTARYCSYTKAFSKPIRM